MAIKLKTDQPNKAADLARATDEELEEHLVALRDGLYHLRYKMHVEEVENPNVKTTMRRNIARVMTVLRQREIDEEEGDEGTDDSDDTAEQAEGQE